MKKKILLAIAALVVALVIAEFVTRAVVVSQTGATDFAAYRARCLGQVNSIFLADAAGELIDLKPNNAHDEKLTINRQGFRGREVADEKPEWGFRICTIGGSGCFGTTSTRDYTTIAGWLEKRLRANSARPVAVEVINGGLPGATTARAISRYEQRLAKFRPDVVILYNLVNDILTSRRTKLGVDPRTRPAVSVRGPVQELLSHSAIWLVCATFVTNREKAADMVDVTKMEASEARKFANKKKQELVAAQDHETTYAYDGNPANNLYLVPEHVAEFRSQLKRYHQVVTASGAVPMFCTFAFRFKGDETQEQYLADGPATALYLPNWKMANDTFRAMNQLIRDVAKETNSPLCDVDAELPRETGFFPDKDTDHLTDAGCEAAAGIIAESLKKHGLLKGAAVEKK